MRDTWDEFGLPPWRPCGCLACEEDERVQVQARAERLAARLRESTVTGRPTCEVCGYGWCEPNYREARRGNPTHREGWRKCCTNCRKGRKLVEVPADPSRRGLGPLLAHERLSMEELSELVVVTPALVRWWAKEGLDYWEADELATMVGTRLDDVWPGWKWDACGADAGRPAPGGPLGPQVRGASSSLGGPYRSGGPCHGK